MRWNEEERLRTIRDLQLLDTEPEKELDEIVELARVICAIPIGLITLVDADRVFHKSHLGLEITDAPRQFAFCNHTIQQEGVMVVEDATKDPRFCTNPFVTEAPNIRFYAGTPLCMQDGSNVGSLCLVDFVPHSLTPEQTNALRILGRLVSVRLQLRKHQRDLERETHALHLSRDNFRAFTNALPVEAYLKDSSGKLVFYNRALAQQAKVTETEWLGKTSYDLITKEIADQVTTEDHYVLRTKRPSESYVEVPGENGAKSYKKVIKVPCLQSDGELMLACIAIDLTTEMQREARLQQLQDDLEAANQKLKTLSLTDELTEIRNRRSFDMRIQEEIALARRTNLPLTLVMIDLDDFKKMNDDFGHVAGDEVLRKTAEILVASKRTEDIAFRYGGEEFAMLLPHSDKHAAGIACERFLGMMKETEWQHRIVSASMGIATFEIAENAKSLVRRADIALYAAKRAGKARCQVYSVDLERLAEARNSA